MFMVVYVVLQLILFVVICVRHYFVCLRRLIVRKMIFSVKNVGISFDIGFVRLVENVIILLAMVIVNTVSMKNASFMG